MDNTLTLDEYLGLPEKIVKISQHNDEVVERIPLKVCNLYDTKDLSNKIGEMFARYRRIKYLYSLEDMISITPDYTPKEIKTQFSTVSKTDRLVQKRVDELTWATRFYNSILNVSSKLTKEESVCLTETLFKTKSADDVATTLGVEPKTVYNIRKSYNIKLWYELEILYEEE